MIRTTIHCILFSLAIGLMLGAGSVARAAEPTAHWSITPYIWAPTTAVDLKFREADIGQGEIKFTDVLDTLDAAFMINVEGGRGRWSAFADLTYLKTSDENTKQGVTIDARNKQLFLDAAVAYRPGGVGSALSLYGGLRLSAFDDRYRFSLGDVPLASRKSTRDYYDALVGIRYRFDLGEHWALLTRADVSFGDSDGTYLIQANMARSVGSRRLNRIMFGYQYKQADFTDGDLKQSFNIHGPLAGFNFRF